MAGARPRGNLIHVGALVLAGAADLAAFAQVVYLVMPDQAAAVTWLLVAGFTAAALYLTHCAGASLRERSEGSPLVARRIATLCLSVWLPLGLAAFWVRLTTVPTSIFGDRVDASSQLPAALIFLALYLASGTVALVGTYLTHNVALNGYLTALRQHQKLVKKAASRARTYQAARCTVGERRNDRERNDLARQATRDAVHALAEELKQEVRVRLAAHLQDAAATDGLMHRGVSADLSPADIVDEPGDEITGIQTRDEPSGYVRQYDFGRTGLVIVDTSTPHAVMSWSGDRLAGRFLQACRALAGQPGASAIVVVNGQRKSGPGPDVVFQCLDEHDAAELDEDCDFVRVDGDDFAVAYHRMPHPGGNGAVVVSFVGMRRHGPDALELVRRTASPSMVRSVRSVMRLEFPAALAGWSAAGTADLFNQRHSAPAAIASIPREASSGRH